MSSVKGFKQDRAKAKELADECMLWLNVFGLVGEYYGNSEILIDKDETLTVQVAFWVSYSNKSAGFQLTTDEENEISI